MTALKLRAAALALLDRYPTWSGAEQQQRCHVGSLMIDADTLPDGEHDLRLFIEVDGHRVFRARWPVDNPEIISACIVHGMWEDELAQHVASGATPVAE